MITKNIRFYKNSLSAVIHYPEFPKKQHPAVLFVHGFVGSKVGAHRLFVKAAQALTEAGYISFRFDFGGCGESDGDYRDVTVSKQMNELKEAITYVSQLDHVDPEQIILIGHSLGGAITSLTAHQFPEIKQIVLWSPVARPYFDITAIAGDEAIEIAEIEGVYDYHGFLLSHDFFEDLKQHQPLETIELFNGSVLIVHGDQDQDVPKENAMTYANQISQKDTKRLVDFTFIEAADHTFSNTAWEQQLFTKTIQWLGNMRDPRS
ncbi:alpha/beta hydrolase family protein [Halalkalibacter kiskunsagensis]|uniref:Alpha/beta hydrolase family protein n=1 Tax=Halalkalibacter kiskunsagensis TaxID=1548599 RepID=A0ABV6KJ37_9BACI